MGKVGIINIVVGVTGGVGEGSTIERRNSAAGGILFNKDTIIYKLTGNQALTLAPSGHSTNSSLAIIQTDGSGTYTLDKGSNGIVPDGDYTSITGSVVTFDGTKKNHTVLFWDGTSLTSFNNKVSPALAMPVAPLFVSAEVTNANPNQLRVTTNANCNFLPTGITLNTDGAPVTLTYLSGNGTNLGIYQISRSIAFGENLTFTAASNNGITNATSGLSMTPVTAQAVTNGVAGNNPTFVSAQVLNANPNQLRVTVIENCNFTPTGLTLNTDGAPVTLTYLSGNGTNLGVYQISRNIADGESLTFTAASNNGITSATTSLPMVAVTNQVVDNNVLYSSYRSLSFNGTDQYVNVPTAAALNVTTGGTKTISFRLYVNSLASVQYPIAKGNTAAATGGWLVQLMTNGRIRGNFRSNTGGVSVWESTTSLVVSTWYFVVITWNAGVMKIYINGVDVTNATPIANTLGSDAITGSYNLRIGSYEQLNSFLNGNVDTVSIIQEAATPAQVAWMHNGGSPRNPNLFAAQGLTFAEHYTMDTFNPVGRIGYHGTGVNMTSANESTNIPA